MHFLVRMWAILPVPGTQSAKERAALGMRQMAYWDDLASQGKLVFTAPYAGRRGRVAIYNASSNAELFDLINADPLFPFLDREVIPLSDDGQIRQLYSRMLQA